MEPELKVLELYSGIGGMHYALLGANLKNCEVVCSVDISPAASLVYKHNFPGTKHWERSIEGFSAKDFDNMGFNTLMMSPPCQPFTRVGLQKDINDPRTRSFIYLMKVLPQLSNPPTYILMENVKGFENSKAHDMFLQVLVQLEYSTAQFLLTPKQFGVPNSRLRYYLLAKRKPLQFPDEVNTPNEVIETMPQALQKCLNSNAGKEQNEKHSIKTLENYLEEAESTLKEHALTEKTLLRYLQVMDIVTSKHQSSTCFTKSYGYYAEGTGSVLNMGGEIKMSNPLHNNLRYFTAREVANIMCFPKDKFHFPENFTRKQKYKLLGNSLNVYVVSCLLKLLITDTKR